jgi:hypothetical protein
MPVRRFVFNLCCSVLCACCFYSAGWGFCCGCCDACGCAWVRFWDSASLSVSGSGLPCCLACRVPCCLACRVAWHLPLLRPTRGAVAEAPQGVRRGPWLEFSLGVAKFPELVHPHHCIVFGPQAPGQRQEHTFFACNYGFDRAQRSICAQITDRVSGVAPHMERGRNSAVHRPHSCMRCRALLQAITHHLSTPGNFLNQMQKSSWRFSLTQKKHDPLRPACSALQGIRWSAVEYTFESIVESSEHMTYNELNLEPS